MGSKGLVAEEIYQTLLSNSKPGNIYILYRKRNKSPIHPVDSPFNQQKIAIFFFVICNIPADFISAGMETGEGESLISGDWVFHACQLLEGEFVLLTFS
jgi:hypothetical protein